MVNYIHLRELFARGSKQRPSPPRCPVENQREARCKKTRAFIYHTAYTLYFNAIWLSHLDVGEAVWESHQWVGACGPWVPLPWCVLGVGFARMSSLLFNFCLLSVLFSLFFLGHFCLFSPLLIEQKHTWEIQQYLLGNKSEQSHLMMICAIAVVHHKCVCDICHTCPFFVLFNFSLSSPSQLKHCLIYCVCNWWFFSLTFCFRASNRPRLSSLITQRSCSLRRVPM